MERSLVVVSGLVLTLSSTRASGEARASPASPARAATTRLAGAYGRLPLSFERYEAQAPQAVGYLSRGPGYAVYVKPAELELVLGSGRGRTEPGDPTGPRRGPVESAVLRMKLLGARPDTTVEGSNSLTGFVNYIRGNDPAKWRTRVPTWGRVLCRDVYPGIDLVFHGEEGQLEYDFVVSPGADPRQIRLAFEGAGDLRLDGEGNLEVALDRGEVVKRVPVVYQRQASTETQVAGRWLLRGKREAGFDVGPYDRSRTLVIDPVIVYSTYLENSILIGSRAIAVDVSGSAYVAGPVGQVMPIPDLAVPDSLDVLVAKLSPSGDSLLYSTYLGGTGDDYVYGIAVDASGSAYVTGQTYSEDFPTKTPYQIYRGADAFVSKLSPSGDSLVYSTYLGGSWNDAGYGIALDPSGSAYVTGATSSPDFPTENPCQPYRDHDAFVSKLSPSGNSLQYSTFFGGTGFDYASSIATDGSGSAYITGSTGSSDLAVGPVQPVPGGLNAFVAKLSATGSNVAFSTYLGGSGYDYGHAIAVDHLGSAYVVGDTESTDFPTRNPYQLDQAGSDVFVTKLSPSGDALVYSTYLGGNDNDFGRGLAVDSLGSAYVTGSTASPDFPTQEPVQSQIVQTDVFVTKFSPAGNGLVYSTYLGGSEGERGHAITVDSQGNAYVTGWTFSEDFPTFHPYHAQPAPGFVTKLGNPPAGFFTVSPCRLIDTRNAVGPYGGPPLSAGVDRRFTLAGVCGIPSTARAVALNIAVSAPSAAGNLRIFPAGTALPVVDYVTYSAGQTRAGNAIVPLSVSGAITVRCTQGSGTTHLILDVSGYFE